MTSDREAFELAAAHIEARKRKLASSLAKPPEAFLGDGDQPAPVEFAPEPEPTCPECGDRGWRWTTGERLTVDRCACRTPDYEGPESVPPIDLVRYGCPPKLAVLQKETWISGPGRSEWPEEADDWPGAYRGDDGTLPDMLLLWGRPGSGKSRVAAWIMRRGMAGGRRCRWISIPELMSKCLRAVGSDYHQRTLEGEVSNWLRADLVILDDVGKHNPSDYQTLQLFNDWLNRLEKGPGWTVATTNKSPADLRAWEESIASRLCAGPEVEMTGRDSRRKTWIKVR